MKKPVLAIVGRPNVGKSTLFNKLTGKRLAIVEDTPGVTRDRIYSDAQWNGTDFLVVDTGGIEPRTDSELLRSMRDQAQLAIAQADVTVFVTDLHCGVTAQDEEIAKMLSRSGKPVILAVNKVDTVGAPPPELYEFYSLGLGDPYPISALHGTGSGEVLDLAVSMFPQSEPSQEDEDAIKVALIGKPNAGKSSMLNRLAGYERSIVSDMPGTTRDAVDTEIVNENGRFVFIDTAGIRRGARIDNKIEHYSVLRAKAAVERSDVCLIMIDAVEGVTAQDERIAGIAHNAGKASIIVVNKWDLVENKTDKVMKTFEEAIRSRFAPFVDFPIVFASALTKQRILKVLEEARKVYENRMIKIPTARLNEEMLPLIEAYPPPATKGKYIKIKYVTQLPNTQVPSFVFFANLPQYVKEPYRRFLENKMREKWDLSGTPINIYIRQK